MKIAIVQGAFLPVPPISGGAVEKIWFRMGKEFAKLGHSVTHISRLDDRLPISEIIDNVSHLRVQGYKAHRNSLWLKILDLIYSVRVLRSLSEDFDIVVTNTFWSPLLIGLFRSTNVYVSVERQPRGQMKFYSKAARLRGCSPDICQAISAELPYESQRRIRYVPNPVPFDIQSFTIEKEKIILYVGRIHPEKGLDVLVEAFIKVTARLDNSWKLVIVGPHSDADGGGGEKYFERICSLSRGYPIEFVGPVFDDEILKSFFARASIFCYPAQAGSGDAAPVAPREAMAYGAVPVVSKLRCFDDFISDGSNGVRYNHLADDQPGELASVLDRLINDSFFREKLKKEALLVMDRFSSQAVAKAFLADFEEILTK